MRGCPRHAQRYSQTNQGKLVTSCSQTLVCLHSEVVSHKRNLQKIIQNAWVEPRNPTLSYQLEVQCNISFLGAFVRFHSHTLQTEIIFRAAANSRFSYEV
jgi:hypothetical protein